MIETMEVTNYIFSQAMDASRKARRENDHDEHCKRCAEYYIEAISFIEALPESVIEQGDRKRDIECLYRDAFDFFVEKVKSDSSPIRNYNTFPDYDNAIKDVETSIEIAERAKKKLELILCNEATLLDLKGRAENLRKKLIEMKEETEADIKRCKAEDDDLFYANYGEWKRQNK